MVTVELIRPWKRFDAGRRLEKTAGAAEVLVQRGIAKIVSAETRRRPKARKPAKAAEPKPQAKQPTKRTNRKR